ncbi:hypothetical protein ACFPM0_20700 [Pseudonocardia sulfidoxydans]
MIVVRGGWAQRSSGMRQDCRSPGWVRPARAARLPAASPARGGPLW